MRHLIEISSTFAVAKRLSSTSRDRNITSPRHAKYPFTDHPIAPSFFFSAVFIIPTYITVKSFFLHV